MEITEVRIKLMEEAGERLQAFCSITFDDSFVIRDLKIIEGTNGPFVAMPSRKLTSHCHGCGSKNHLRAVFCNQCGARLKNDRAIKDEDGRAKLYADIAHPINSACREMIQERVIREFYAELDRAKLPGYISRYDDIDLDDVTLHMHAAHSESVPPAHHRPHANREGSGSSGGNSRDSSVRPPVQRPPSHDRTVSQAQSAERHPRGPHHAPSARSGSLSQGSVSPAGAAPAASPAAATPPQSPAVVPAGKQEGFGAGIF